MSSTRQVKMRWHNSTKGNLPFFFLLFIREINKGNQILAYTENKTVKAAFIRC